MVAHSNVKTVIALVEWCFHLSHAYMYLFGEKPQQNQIVCVSEGGALGQG